MSDEAKPDQIPSSESDVGRIQAIADYSKSKMKLTSVDISARVRDFDPKKAVEAVLDAPKRLKREWQRSGATGVITRFPIATVALFLMITVYFVTTSGFLDDTAWDDDPDKPALNVNGDMEVYLPEGSEVKELINLVEEDWTTNVMVIYIESNNNNITDQRILQEISYVEKAINPFVSDNESDDVIYILSISTVLKEINSSLPRIREAFITQLGQQCPTLDELCEGFAGSVNNAISTGDDQFGGGYEIPTQTTIDLIIGEMYENDGSPTPGLDKLARNTNDCSQEPDAEGTDDNGCLDGEDLLLDRAIMAVAFNDIKPKAIIEETQNRLDNISMLERPCEFDANGNSVPEEGLCVWGELTADQRERGVKSLGISMTLTGPIPITNSVTEFSFRLFWEIFPLAVVLVAIGLFVFHSDLLQAGISGIRPIQGIKVVIIAGLPTLCAVFWTLGIIGATNYEVTMTVIIVGPILLALGVSYGLHITNRYAEEGGSRSQKMRASMQSTGRAVFLSAVTTVIGFISLIFTPMAPIQTVGIALSGGIVVVYVLTMFMVPNLTLILDLRKPKHPPLKIFDAAVEIPMKRNKSVIAFFVFLVLISSTLGQANVEENIDLLGMAPEGEEPVIKMKQYSEEFNAGQIGMVLVHANVTGDQTDNDPTNDDPYQNLKIIDGLERNLNTVENASAVSVVFLMKATGLAPTLSGQPILNQIEELPGYALLPEDVRDTFAVLMDQEVTQGATFWDLLTTPEDFGLPGSTQSQIFLLDVFYSSLTKEMREIFINSDYDRTLVYIDMPFIPVADTKVAVDQINEYTEGFQGVHQERAEKLTGVAATAIEVNQLIVDSQWTSLGFAIILTLITLAVVFKDIRYSFWTTSPVIATVALQWLVMWQMDVPLSLVTVMIGSILVGVGVDFSIHISNRIRELGGGLDAIRSAAVGTGMSLFEAAVVTSLGMFTAYQIPIPEIKPFVTVILILLWVAAASALLLLPAIFVTLEKMGIGAVGGPSGMARKLGLGRVKPDDPDVLEAVLVMDSRSDEAW
jgi:predicted RND superfamily exporter protein